MRLTRPAAYYIHPLAHSFCRVSLGRAIIRRMDAGHRVTGLYLTQLRHRFPALCSRHPAAGMEHASSWWIERAGYLSREGYALSLSVYDRVGDGYGGKERLSVG